MPLDAAPPCPSCRAPLTPANLRWNVLTCRACGGVWADSAASERIATVVDRDLVNVAKEAAMSADGPPEAGDEIVRRCPVCDAPLVHTKRARVSIDVCTAHGTWFDRDELGRMARNLDYDRLSRASSEATPGESHADDASIAMMRSIFEE